MNVTEPPIKSPKNPGSSRTVDGLLGGEALWKVLGYPTAAAFRQAVSRGTVPVPLVEVSHRRGRFARIEHVNVWLEGLKPSANTSSTEDRMAQPRHLEFGALVRQVREAHGLSQKHVALTADLDQSYLAGLEAGRRPPPRAAVLSRLVDALNVSDQERARLTFQCSLTRLARALSAYSDTDRRLLLQLGTALRSMPASRRAAIAEVLDALIRQSNREEASMT